MLIAFNEFRCRHRQCLAAVLLAFALSWLVLMAHSALAEGHMGDEMAACLAIAQTAALALGVVVAAGSAGRPAPPWPWESADDRSRIPSARRRPIAPSRAGPEVLQVFRC